MKRKTIVLLSSVLAASLLVGGAFAGYAVTDNADPIGINVTPGANEEDDTKYVTLDWGQQTNLESVGLLQLGETRRVGTVNLVASRSYTGVFSLSLEDKTSPAHASPKLFDYLEAYVYEGVLETPDSTKLLGKIDGETALTGAKKVFTKDVTSTAEGYKMTIFVAVNDKASPSYPDLQADKVWLEVDWGVKDSSELAQGKTVSFKKPEGWGNTINAFAWTGSKNNAEYPGVAMVNIYDDIYELLIPGTGDDSLNSIIFNDGKGEGKHQTVDLDFTGFDQATKPCFIVSGESEGKATGAWAAKPGKTETVDVTATKNGNDLELEDVKPTTSENIHEYKITLAVGDELVFTEGLTTIHFYTWDNEQGKAVDKGASFTATVAGVHTFYFNQDHQMYFTEPVAQTTNFKVVGSMNDWKYSEGIALVFDTDHFKTAATALAEGAKFKLFDNTGDAGWRSNQSEWQGCGFTLDNDGNIVVSTAGTYVINFYPNTTNGNYVTLVAQPAQA